MNKLSLLLAAPILLASCGSDSSDGPADCQGAKCDTLDDVLNSEPIKECASSDLQVNDGEIARLDCTPCGDTLGDRSGRAFVPAFIANDALVKHVYMTFEDSDQNGEISGSEIDCPVTFPEVMAKLEKFDTENCNGIESRVISEQAALLGKDNAGYRAVTSRDCDGRGKSGLLFSTFGFQGFNDSGATHISNTGSPGQLEIIAFDETLGVFNYYKELGGTMNFFGSSLDFVAAGPGGPGLTNQRGCANCHPGGGLIMKELESPWTHWALEDNIDGASELVSNRSDYMGTLASGADMQFGVTQAGNEKWNASKADFFKSVTNDQLNAARSSLRDDNLSSADLADMRRRKVAREVELTATQKLLEPLFCSLQVNIVAGGSFGVPGQLFAAQRNGLFVFPDVDSNGDDYAAGLETIGSSVAGFPADQNDITGEFMTITRSHEDANYVDQLVELAVIDSLFTQDVMMVDFTRPVFSDDRCGLLQFVPDLAPGDRNLKDIRDGLIENLKDVAESLDGTPAGQLLAHLEATKDGASFNHDGTRQVLSDACSALPPTDVLRDGLKLRSLRRKLAFSGDGPLDDSDGEGQHPVSVFEFEDSMATDAVRVLSNASATSDTTVRADARFSPLTCTLVDEFESTENI